MKNRNRFFCCVAASVLALGIASCKKDKNQSGLRKIHAQNQNTEIRECRLDGRLVYDVSYNAHDAGSEIYDSLANRIGVCSYGWGNVDSTCNRLTDCETIYRIPNNIWGQPAVDKYGLGY